MSTLNLIVVALAVLWPAVAGGGLLLWLRWRRAQRDRRLAAARATLKASYDVVQSAPLPDHLLLAVDALDEQDAVAAAAAYQRTAAPERTKTPSGT